MNVISVTGIVQFLFDKKHTSEKRREQSKEEENDAYFVCDAPISILQLQSCL